MTLFVHQNPIVLTDTIFTMYGGLTGSSTPAQRQAAYTIAEEAAEQDIGTFLLPTTVTGTYLFASSIELEHSYVRQAIMAWVKSFDGNIQFTVSGTSNWYLALRDQDYGIVDFGRYIHWAGYIYDPYQVDIVYEAGLPSGSTYTPNMLMALTTVAQIELNEIIGYGNESSGDVGVQEFTNQKYHEKRVGMFATSMGNSAKALHAHKLLSKYRRYTRVGMGKPIR